jgi:hypothetical protein
VLAVVPAGYFLKGPGQVAPCPKGEWKSGTATEGNCTRCAQGVTTEAMAAISEASCNSKWHPVNHLRWPGVGSPFVTCRARPDCCVLWIGSTDAWNAAEVYSCVVLIALLV